MTVVTGSREMLDPAGQVDVQPAGDAAGQRREDDLVEVLAAQGVFDGVHRVVPDRPRALNPVSGGLLEEWQCEPPERPHRR